MSEKSPYKPIGMHGRNVSQPPRQKEKRPPMLFDGGIRKKMGKRGSRGVSCQIKGCFKLSDADGSVNHHHARVARSTLPQGMTIQQYMQRSELRRSKRKAKAKELWAKPDRKTILAQLDHYWSLIVRRRDRHVFTGRCLICHSRPIEVGYHLVPKQRGYAIHWDIDNGVGACCQCNFAEQKNRSLYRQKHVDLFGKEKIEALEAKAATKVQFNLTDLIALRDDLKFKLEGRQ